MDQQDLLEESLQRRNIADLSFSDWHNLLLLHFIESLYDSEVFCQASSERLTEQAASEYKNPVKAIHFGKVYFLIIKTAFS